MLAMEMEPVSWVLYFLMMMVNSATVPKDVMALRDWWSPAFLLIALIVILVRSIPVMKRSKPVHIPPSPIPLVNAVFQTWGPVNMAITFVTDREKPLWSLASVQCILSLRFVYLDSTTRIAMGWSTKAVTQSLAFLIWIVPVFKYLNARNPFVTPPTSVTFCPRLQILLAMTVLRAQSTISAMAMVVVLALRLFVQTTAIIAFYLTVQSHLGLANTTLLTTLVLLVPAIPSLVWKVVLATPKANVREEPKSVAHPPTINARPRFVMFL
jgi:hypothetical protein